VGDAITLFQDLVRAEIRLYNLVDERLRAAHGASVGQVQLLGIIDRTENARVDDISRELDIRAGSASKAVDRLVASGWVRRASNPLDRRSSLLSLTDSGAELLAAATPTFEAAVSELTAGTLSSEELRALAATLARLRAALFNGLQRLSGYTGGAGSYWIPRRTSLARAVDARRATRCSAMSMPADTPAELTMSPSSTKRSSGRTSMVPSSSASSSRDPQWVVAGRPASKPAAA
jgi:DNA-binding MarR family transcriptional regulator